MATKNRNWKASWIWNEQHVGKRGMNDHQLAYFRRTFTVPTGAIPKLVLDVTADSRYRLFVNGQSVCVGPCKGDQFTHYYETVDVSHLLIPGVNTVAVVVLHYRFSLPFEKGVAGPISIWRTPIGGLLVEGILKDEMGKEIEHLHTDDQWKSIGNHSFQIVPSQLVMWLGGVESVDGNHVPHGWTSTDYDDSAWNRAITISNAHGNYGELMPWLLTVRPIPMLYETDTRFSAIKKYEGVAKEQAVAWLESSFGGSHSITLEPHSRVTLELDAGELTTAYITLAMRGGSGTVIRILCSECYEPIESDPNLGGCRVKGVRDDESGKLVGDPDVYLVSGMGGKTVKSEVYEPFWFRTFRFVRLEVDVAEEAMILESFSYRETGYPLDVQANFQCSDAELNEMWELSVRSLRRCMHETYEDCPYYEQLQYSMDTRLQMLFTYQLSADDRLGRRALYDFHSSRLPSGMLQSRYPSALPQVIPSFSLYFIDMVDEHYTYFGDLGVIKQYIPTILALLDWFENRKTEEGLVGPTPTDYWTYFDWVQGWPDGAPAWSDKVPVMMLSLMYAAALKKSGKLLSLVGWNDAGQEILNRASSILKSVKQQAWSAEKRLYRDGSGIEEYSQHTQVWAVLSGMVTGDEARILMQKTLAEQLTEVSLPMAYGLFTALQSVGLYKDAFKLWDRWRLFAGKNLTTLPEDASDGPRSDCHAWSAVPLIQFPLTILGVKPDEPGYGSLRIEPHIHGLLWAKGRVATVRGMVDVDWKIDGENFEIKVVGPKDMKGTVCLPDGSERQFIGETHSKCCIPHSLVIR